MKLGDSANLVTSNIPIDLWSQEDGSDVVWGTGFYFYLFPSLMAQWFHRKLYPVSGGTSQNVLVMCLRLWTDQIEDSEYAVSPVMTDQSAPGNCHDVDLKGPIVMVLAGGAIVKRWGMIEAVFWIETLGHGWFWATVWQANKVFCHLFAFLMWQAQSHWATQPEAEPKLFSL